MLSFFIGIQYVGIIIIFAQVMVLLFYRPSYLQRMLLIVELATLVNHVGCLLMMQATTEETALMAVKFSYIGKPYILLAIFLFLLQFYRVYMPMAVKCVLCMFHVCISLLVLTCEKHTLFYSSMEFVHEGYYPHMVFGYGPVYIINTVLILGYFLVGVVLSIVKYKTMRTRDEQKCAFYLDVILLTGAIGLFAYFTGKTGGYDTTLPAYLIGNILLHVCVIRYNMLDALEAARDVIVEEIAQGILVTTPDDKIIFENDQLKQIFSEDGAYEAEQVYQKLQQYAQLEGSFSIGKHVYEVQQKEIQKRGIKYGQMYVVSDVTESHNHAVEMEHQMVIAEMANRAKSDFLARMSHEIRTPINAITGMDEMILRESHEPGVKKYAMNIKSAASTLLSLINDILDSSKIESGKLEIVPMEYELDSLLNDVINAVYLKAVDKGLKLVINVDESIPNHLYGDDVRVRQILVNLLNNAVKYTQTGTIWFTVANRSDEARTLLYFEVKDTGIGIKKEDLPKLCEAFERIEVSRNRNIEGTGLGMSIVSDLLHLMHTHLKVQSEYGVGSTFSFELEQRAMAAEQIGNYEERISRMRQSTAYECRFTAPRAKLLVVDDNDVNREVFCGLLRQTRVQIVDVPSGAGCLEEAAKQHFDIIFLDHMMPDMDGIETLQRLRQIPDCPCSDTPVVALTANAVTGAKERYLEVGFDAYLSKPIVSEKLETLIAELLPEELLEPYEGADAAAVMQGDQDAPAAGMVTAAARPHTAEVSAPGEELPQIEQIDWDYAHIFVKDDHLLAVTLKNVYRALDSDMRELTKLVENIYNEDGMAAYRIKVHAMKSTNASVGAVMISQLAKLLEQKAIEGDAAAIEQMQPVFMELLEEFGHALDDYYMSAQNVREHGASEEPTGESAGEIAVGEAAEGSETAGAEAGDHLRELIHALDTYDYDGAERLIETLEAYDGGDEWKQLLRQLGEQEFALDYAQCAKTAEQMLAIVSHLEQFQ